MAEDLKQIAERFLSLVGGRESLGNDVELVHMLRDGLPDLARGYKSLLEENKRLRDAVDRAAGMLENACKQSCEAFAPYGKHAPECHWDIAEELREALGKGEGTASE